MIKASHLARQNVDLMLARPEQGVDNETAEVAQAAGNSDDRHGGGKMAKRLLERIPIGEGERERERERERETKSDREKETKREKRNRRWCLARAKLSVPTQNNK